MTVKVNDKVWRDLKRKLGKSINRGVRVGVLSSKGADASHDSHKASRPGKGSEDISMIELAAIHEFGSPAAGIPKRSFLVDTFKGNQREMEAFALKLAKGIILNRFSHLKALEMLGLWGVKQIKNRITSGDGIAPKNADSTIAKKKSDRPLVDTGRLINAINHEVE